MAAMRATRRLQENAFGARRVIGRVFGKQTDAASERLASEPEHQTDGVRCPTGPTT